MSDSFNSANSIYISIRCIGLNVSSKTQFPNVGLLSNLYLRTISSNVKNERKQIRISQSDHFRPGGRPSSSLFDQIYTSEYFDDSVAIISPSLLAQIKTVEDMDSKIRINVYYSSSLTGGKEVLLAATTFSERELFNNMASNGLLTMDMTSDYCSASKVYVEIIPNFPPLLDEVFCITSPRYDRNPLSQDYVFFHDQDFIMPHIDAKELCWEPKFTTMIPILFLNNVLSALGRSTQSWQLRYELERMRQSRFYSDHEALTSGWHVIEIIVSSASMKFLNAYIAKNSVQDNQASSNNPVLYTFHYPLNDASAQQYPDAPFTDSPALSGKFPGNKSKTINNIKRVDDAMPSTFINISLENRDQCFSFPIGHTNTEYHTLNPVYGSNLNSSYVRKPNIFATSANDTVQLVSKNNEYSFQTYINSNRYHAPRSATDSTDDDSNLNSSPIPSVDSNSLPDEEVSSVTHILGKQNRFRKYISTLDNSSLVFDFYIELPSGKKVCIGNCSLPLDKLSTNMKLPVKLSAPYDTVYKSVDLNVEIFIDSQINGLDAHQATLSKAPDSMPSAYHFKRNIDGSILDSRKLSFGNNDHTIDFQTILSNCYEWLWFLGYAGIDPLIFDSDSSQQIIPNNKPKGSSNQEEEEIRRHSDDRQAQDIIIQIERSLSADDIEENQFSGKNRRGSRVRIVNVANAIDSDDEIPHMENLSFQHSRSNSLQVSSAVEDLQIEDEKTPIIQDLVSVEDNPEEDKILSENTAEASWQQNVKNQYFSEQIDSNTLIDESEQAIQRELNISGQENRSQEKEKLRVDVIYPLPWLQTYIEELQKLMAEIQDVLTDMRKNLRSGKCFRASPLKKEPLLQAIPTNLHYQLLGIRSHGVDKPSQPESYEIIHSITCGSLTPHFLGHKQGGLYHQESLLVNDKRKINIDKNLFTTLRKRDGQNCIRPESKVASYSKLMELKDDTLKFENFCLNIGRRKIYAISQGLSVVINALLLKLNLLITNHIPESLALKWFEIGFLVVFEGLLSVVGSERSMLEDTMNVIDTMKYFEITLLRFPEDELGSENVIDEHQDLDFAIDGREIKVFIPRKSFKNLPGSFQKRISEKDARIKISSILFTQGIDIQQTMMTTLGDSNKKRNMSSLDLQHHVNMKGLREINQYCLRFRPIRGQESVDKKIDGPFNTDEPYRQKVDSNVNDGKRESIEGEFKSTLRDDQIHPLVENLYNSLKTSSLAMKNVDLLIELERLTLNLGGCRITFCKSGKDRTGMAVTLEQSRQLGERFGCGNSLNRLLRDTNLMRVYGCRVKVAEKNIGKPVYSINRLQAQFLPELFRPPLSVCEDILKKDNS